ncbi:MAG: SpoIIE family protein phosphatase [bacterium]|nr:SpoIIE family protein phosphatase [bacterium]
MTTNTKNRIAQIVVMAAGFAVLAIGLLIEARDVTRVAKWSGSGFVLCAAAQQDSTTTFFTVDPNDFVSAPYPQRGDTILTIADSAATLDSWIRNLEVAHTPGREVHITFLHQGVERETTIRTRPVDATLRVSVFILQVLKVLIFLSFVGVAFWAYLKRPYSPPVRVLALYGFSMATFMVTAFLPMYAVMAAFRIPFEVPLLAVVRSVGVFFSGFWLLLQMYFPRPAPLLQRRPLLTYALCLLPWMLIVAFAFSAAPLFKLPDNVGLRFVIYPIAVLQVLAGLGLLTWNHRHAQTYLEKRQTKLVLWGSGGGLVLFLFYLLERYGILSDLFRLPLAPRLLATDLIFLILLLSPLSLAYAFGKYRLLDIEGRLRRGTRHLLTLALMLALLFAIGYYASEIISRSFARGSFWNLAVTIAVVVGILRGAQSVQKNLERRFYPERQRLRQMIQDFLQRTASFADQRTFWNQLEERLRDGLAVEGVYPVLRAADDRRFLLRDDASTPFGSSSPLVLKMEREGRPIMVDEALSGTHIPMSEEEVSWLMRNRVALLLPMVTHGRLVGFLGFGMKVEREDYAPEEIRILSSLAPQVALAGDNMRLIAENVEKRRMEEELQVARRVQERFLPKVLPKTPGLSIAAKSVFCLEVAGDYYDVIALTGGRTALAIGDVSGKGAGAALIMASLQASLRVLCGLNLTLDDLMLRANELIHQNTEPDQFITLFVGVFDPQEHVLRYVNAGHNFPILIRRAGRDQMLDEGGLILGPFPDATYEQGCVRLAPGDALLLYTDGVSEAMNESGDELGEELVRDVLRAHADETPGEIIAQVMSLVDLHQGGRSPEDDQTLLAVRVV